MAERKRSWLKGCLIGCGAIVFLAIIVVGGCIGVMVKRTGEGFDTAAEARETLEAQHGDPTSFVPWADGRVPADRIETFADIQEATLGARTALANAFAGLPMTPERARELEDQQGMEKVRSILSVVRSGVGLGRSIGKVAEARNVALVEHGMGMGEYTYLHNVVYGGWLVGEDGELLSGIPAEVEREIAQSMSVVGNRRVRELLRTQLASQLDAARQGTVEPEWLAELEAEHARLEEESRGLPWSAGIPERTQDSIELYRGRLEESYVPIASMFEVLIVKKKGFSYEME